MKKLVTIILNIIPIVLMIALISLINSDYVLSLVYLFIIVISFVLKREKNDCVFFLFGFFIMIISEYFFVSTGVETFVRKSLFGLMPLWLPILWAYAFVVIKRAIVVLGEK